MKLIIEKIVCFLKGHEWNKYAEISAYPKRICNRCGYEEYKPGRKEVPKVTEKLK